VLAQDGYDPLCSTPRDIEDIVVRRVRQRMEHKLSRRRVVASDVDPIERQRVKVHIEPQGRVEPLKERHRTGVRILDTLQPEQTVLAGFDMLDTVLGIEVLNEPQGQQLLVKRLQVCLDDAPATGIET
jgi:hypothetical protein